VRDENSTPDGLCLYTMLRLRIYLPCAVDGGAGKLYRTFTSAFFLCCHKQQFHQLPFSAVSGGPTPRRLSAASQPTFPAT
jgi:hypothetical protein